MDRVILFTVWGSLKVLSAPGRYRFKMFFWLRYNTANKYKNVQDNNH